MRGRLLLGLSLVLNFVLVAMLGSLARHGFHESSPQPAASRFANPGTVVRTNVVVRRLNFVWNQIESDDYPTYIANLRNIGCPEAPIRDIIVADVNELFARRRATEIVTARQQWWRSDPDPEIVAAGDLQLRELEDERRELLTRLLGSEWQSSYYPYPEHPTANPLDGPILGSLSPELKESIHRVEIRAADQLDAYMLAVRREGAQPSESDFERLHQETRRELAALLNPEQLEEYLLRYSRTATDLREDLRGIDLTPEAFRNLFRLGDSLEQQTLSLESLSLAEQSRQREDLELQKTAGLEEILGEEAFQEYQRLKDPAYRESRRLADSLEIPVNQRLVFHEITRTTQAEQQRVQNDSSLTEAQQALALREIAVSRDAALRRVFGEALLQRYLESQAP